MADYKDSPGGRQDAVYTHDEGDGTFARAVASHLRGWDATDGCWYRIPIDHTTGSLKVLLAAGTVDIGIVDQGAGGSSAWKVTDPALADGSQRVGGTVTITAAALPLPSGAATETTLGGVKTGTDKIPSGLTVTSTRLLVDGSGVTQPVSDGGGSLTVDGTVAISGTVPVSAAALPLPTGAATDLTFQAAVGVAGIDPPASATVLDRLISIERAVRTQGQAIITALQPAPAVKRRPTTLLHRS